MKKDFKQEYFSIPNLMGYFRLLVVPIYLYLYINAKETRDYYIAAGIMALSFLTDLFDGQIARRFHMVTEFGKILDPVADKITQGAMAISFSFRFPAMVPLLILFLLKEGFMGLAGAYMMKRGYRMDGAQMHGKVCTVVLDLAMLVILAFPKINYTVVNLIVAVCVGFMVYSFGCYVKMYWKVWKQQRGNE